jgi:tetraacyldisaccharide 4'-kinase
MSRLSRFFLSTWQQRGLAAQLLRPAAALYGFLLKRKALVFRPTPAQALPQPRPPIIVVGNMVVGGVGKTPILMALVLHLQSSGYRPGVISRGYGRQAPSAEPLAVLPSTPAALAGDEPLLIAHNTGVPVVVAADRVAAVAALCAAHPEVDVLLSDDGLQHWGLPRELEIVVWDTRGLGNGFLLPAGLLREPWPRPAWHPYATQNAQTLHLYAGEPPKGLPLDSRRSWAVSRTLADFALDAHGQCHSLASLSGQGVAAVAGIAQPEAFFTDLCAHGLTLAQTVALPDHADVAAWWRGLPASEQTRLWLCTQKDAVKLWAVCPTALAVPLSVHLPAVFFEAVEIALAAASSRS